MVYGCEVLKPIEMKPKLTKDLVEFSEKRLISDKIRFFEIGAVLITAIGKFIFMDFLNWRLQYVVFAIIAWSVYVFNRYKQEKNILKYWGFRTDNFKKTVKLMLPFAMLSIVSFVIIGFYQNTLNVTWHILPLLITYPLWGTIQQFITIALVAGNLSHLNKLKMNKFSVIFITAILFSVAHFPSTWLMIGTFLLAIFYGIIYLKMKNIYAMGIFHGWLGAVFYYTVVNQDPFQEIFLKFLS